MKRYMGGETVEPGLYFSARQLSFKSVDEAGPLPGAPHEVFRRVPVLALMVVGPVLGLAYVIFLPFIGVAMVLYLLGLKTGEAAAGAARGAAHILRPGWEPRLAFFSRSKPRKAEPTTTDEWAEEARKKLGSGGTEKTR